MYQISINENISRIVKTSKFTKTLRPTFGLDRYIDKQMSLSEILAYKRDLKSQIETYEPRAQEIGIDITPDENGKLETKVTYKVKDSELKDEIRVSL